MPESASMLHLNAMTADKGMLKYERAAAAVRGQIADGTLRPGQPAPSGAELSRLTGYSTLTCRRALRELIADGVLTPGPSRNARPRVAGVPQPPAERTLAATSRALSAGLAARRRANGLTQPELAGLVGISVTTVGHAETGRLWQSRQFWVRADAVLDADGSLLRLHDAYREAGAASERGLRLREQREQEAAELAQAHFELAEQRTSLESANLELARSRQKCQSADARHTAIQQSLSWKITAPLRYLGSFLRFDERKS